MFDVLHLSLFFGGKGVKIYREERVKFILNFLEEKGLKFIQRGKG